MRADKLETDAATRVWSVSDFCNRYRLCYEEEKRLRQLFGQFATVTSTSGAAAHCAGIRGLRDNGQQTTFAEPFPDAVELGERRVEFVRTEVLRGLSRGLRGDSEGDITWTVTDLCQDRIRTNHPPRQNQIDETVLLWTSSRQRYDVAVVVISS